MMELSPTVRKALAQERRKIEEEVSHLKFQIDLLQSQLDSAVDRRGNALRELHELQVALGEKKEVSNTSTVFGGNLPFVGGNGGNYPNC